MGGGGGGGAVIDSTMGDDAYIGVGLNDCHTPMIGTTTHGVKSRSFDHDIFGISSMRSARDANGELIPSFYVTEYSLPLKFYIQSSDTPAWRPPLP